MGKRLIMQRRGSNIRYRSPSFKYKGEAKHLPTSVKSGVVTELVHCLGHSAPLMRVKAEDKQVYLMIAPIGIAIGDTVSYEATEPSVGHSFELKDLPDGTVIYNLELRPGDGGKIARSSGTSARLITKTGDNAVVLLPSKKKKTIKSTCRATIGVVACGGRTDKPYLKAGNKYHKLKRKKKVYPKVSGASMNALDHPFGSGRSSRKSKAKPVRKNAPPGRKTGMLRARRSGRKK